MSKELEEALKNIKIRCHSKVIWNDPIDFDLEIVEQALIKSQEQEKAFEIIFEKNVNTLLLELAGNVDEYNERMVPNNLKLTQEEFNLLKEMVECLKS